MRQSKIKSIIICLTSANPEADNCLTLLVCLFVCLFTCLSACLLVCLSPLNFVRHNVALYDLFLDAGADWVWKKPMPSNQKISSQLHGALWEKKLHGALREKKESGYE
jgi:hypothetical protein